MFHNWKVFLVLAAALGSLTAEDKVSADKPWQKPVPEWTADDAHQVMTDSPWVKTSTPAVDKPANLGQQRRSSGGRGGRGGGINIGGIGIGLLDMGGMGRRGGGSSGGNYPESSGRTDSTTPPTLTLRWESALPIREAELRGRDVDAPTVDEDHYAIAVLGVPRDILKADSRAMEEELKKLAALKRDGK